MSWGTAITWVVVGLALALSIKPLGSYIARVFTDQPTWMDRVWGPVEAAWFRAVGVQPEQAMTARQYALALVATGAVWMVAAYALLRLQGRLPFNPERFPGLSPALAFNTAASFVTNTNWQAYAGEHTLSAFSQFGVLSYLQFVTPAMGGAAGIAFARAVAGRPLGNFFVDLTRMCTRLLLPLAVVLTLLLVWQGVPENLGPYLHLHTVTGATQVVPQGPIASWEAIEHLGQNGGGYTAANSANPLENPTPFSNVLETVAMGLIPVAMVYAFGEIAGRRRFAWMLIAVAGFILAVMVAVLYVPEAAGNPLINALGLHGHGNWVGKELRFGLGGTTIFTAMTMATSTGSVVSAHDSWLPLASLAFFIGMFLNMVYGGTGVGLLNLLMFVVLAIFLIGLMVGRTPEFMGKKIEAREVSLAALAFLVHPLLILAGTALAVADPVARAAIGNPGPHGLTEILYAFSSGAANNGSAMGGLNAALPFYEVALGVVMIIGRFVSIIAMLYLGEALLAKTAVPETAGTMRTDTVLFGSILVGIIVVVNALTFFPVAALGPLAEHYLLGAHVRAALSLLPPR